MEVGCSRIWGLVPTTQSHVGGTPHKPALPATQPRAPPATPDPKSSTRHTEQRVQWKNTLLKRGAYSPEYEEEGGEKLESTRAPTHRIQGHLFPFHCQNKKTCYCLMCVVLNHLTNVQVMALCGSWILKFHCFLKESLSIFNYSSCKINNHNFILLLIAALAKSFREKTKVHFGLYFSLFEWFHPLYVKDKENQYHTQEYVKVPRQI